MVKKQNSAIWIPLYITTVDIYKDTTEDVELRFYTSNYELERLLPKGEKSNWINER